MKKKSKQIKNVNQSSFYFEDYLETNKKNRISKKSNVFQDRIYLLFFLFFSLIFIFSISIINISLNTTEISNQVKGSSKFTLQRRDIVDRNGILISRNVKSYDVAIKPSLIKDKKNFLIKIRLNFPNLLFDEIEKKLNRNKYFYLKRRIENFDNNIIAYLQRNSYK